ncbi:MAG: prepilin-type N-terminal cleavage/methylation domain-containing protein [Chloroflexi bacterium]|nr:prepilin-type N-terminal cleavage/methylation domain-containing protein [Chloroflexota bacterium]MBI3931586.1 prepilin-type N-terminal cleavage/methylation domain-containing protein [Chloroflexota bacterium]
MKPGEKGYTLLELLVSMTIIVMVAGAASVAIFQILRNTQRNNDHLTVARQVENAGYWISRDAQMTQGVTTTANLTLPDFLSLRWTEWDDDGDPIYHSANYTLESLTNGIGTLKRTYESSAGASEQTLIAQYIYYDPADAGATSNTSYQDPVLTVKLTAVFKQAMESREYQITRRPGL